MQKTILTVLLFASFLVPAGTQTTGVPGINDLTVFGSTSGSTSCNTVNIPPFTPFTVDVSAGASLPVAIFVTLCPCAPGTKIFPATTCPLPFTAGSGFSNQSIDIPVFTPGCPLILLAGATDALGNMTYPVPGLPPLSFSIQAVVLDPFCATSALPGVLTQAYDVSIP